MRRSTLLAGAVLTALAASIAGARRASAECSAYRSAFWNAAAAPASVSCRFRDQSRWCCVVDGMPEDRYIATIRKVGLDLGITPRNRRWPGASTRR